MLHDCIRVWQEPGRLGNHTHASAFKGLQKIYVKHWTWPIIHQDTVRLPQVTVEPGHRGMPRAAGTGTLIALQPGAAWASWSAPAPGGEGLQDPHAIRKEEPSSASCSSPGPAPARPDHISMTSGPENAGW